MHRYQPEELLTKLSFEKRKKLENQLKEYFDKQESLSKYQEKREETKKRFNEKQNKHQSIKDKITSLKEKITEIKAKKEEYILLVKEIGKRAKNSPRYLAMLSLSSAYLLFGTNKPLGVLCFLTSLGLWGDNSLMLISAKRKEREFIPTFPELEASEATCEKELKEALTEEEVCKKEVVELENLQKEQEKTETLLKEEEKQSFTKLENILNEIDPEPVIPELDLEALKLTLKKSS